MSRRAVVGGVSGVAGVAAAVLAGAGIPAAGGVALVAVGIGCALAAVLLASTTATIALLGVVVAGPALRDGRPSAVQLTLLAAAITCFVLAPHWHRAGETSWLAALAGVPFGAAVALLAEHTSRGTAPYLIGLAALVIAFFVAMRPALRDVRPTERAKSAGMAALRYSARADRMTRYRGR